MSNRYYDLNLEDFKRVFEFGTKYYIDPGKNTTGRTTGEPRGLGAILDAFTLGKLTEIGVEKILFEMNKSKKMMLDFDIKGNNVVMDEPDIVGVYEKGMLRDTGVFVEVKNTSAKDRWIGLTEEQFNTIRRGAGKKKIYMIYATVESTIEDGNPKSTDLTGMFLKEIEDVSKSTIFQKFADLNAKCKIEFVLTVEDIDNFAFPFERGMNMYETNIFDLKNRKVAYNSSNSLRKDIIEQKDFKNFDSNMELKIGKNTIADHSAISNFKIHGSFRLLEKKSSTLIECISDVIISNDVFGRFNLKNGEIHGFNLKTVGRDPKLKRNNLFIAKRRIYQLIEDGHLRKPEDVMKEIAQNI